jgi:hypothetical protein
LESIAEMLFAHRESLDVDELVGLIEAAERTGLVQADALERSLRALESGATLPPAPIAVLRATSAGVPRVTDSEIEALRGELATLVSQTDAMDAASAELEAP